MKDAVQNMLLIVIITAKQNNIFAERIFSIAVLLIFSTSYGTIPTSSN